MTSVSEAANGLTGRTPEACVAPPLFPRPSKRWGIGRTLLCGMPTCDGPVGGLAMTALLRAVPLRLPPHPGSADLRAMVEAQAPAAAGVAVVWVLQEGFAYSPVAQAWVATKRGDARRQALRTGSAPERRATHRPRPRAAGDPTFAVAVPLPAAIRCPQRGCHRVNSVTREFLEVLFAAVAADLNNVALALRDDASVRRSWIEARFEMPYADYLRLADSDPTFIPRLRFFLPELALLEGAYWGRPVGAEDFFAVDLPRPVMVPQPDAGHAPAPKPDRGR